MIIEKYQLTLHANAENLIKSQRLFNRHKRENFSVVLSCSCSTREKFALCNIFNGSLFDSAIATFHLYIDPVF